MSIDHKPTVIEELHETVRRIQAGIRDPEAAKEAIAILAKEREELRKRIGTVDLAVPLIRDARNQ